MTWKLNVDGIHDPEPTQTKDCVLGVSRSKTKNILSLSAKLMLMNAKTYTQKLSPSTQLFGIFVTTNSSYFSCPTKTGTSLAKMIHKSFNILNTKRYKSCIPSQQYHFQHSTNVDWLYTASLIAPAYFCYRAFSYILHRFATNLSANSQVLFSCDIYRGNRFMHDFVVSP